MAVLKDLIVHGPSRFINTAQFEALKANRIGAEEGVFNKLIATNADIGTLDVDDLTAQNATVVGLLDVQGEMHTNSWTNANIANIGGSFYIAPTIIPTDGTTTISITKNSATSWTVVLSGTFATDFIKTGTNTTGQNWPANSLVLITGNITVKNMKYPLGTLKGTLSAAVTASAASTSKTVTITGVTDGQGHTTPAVLDELWTLNGANISNAAFSDGKISLYKMGSFPIGIQMSSMGTNANSMIEIYGGVAANPTVRIGHLAGLPAINGTSPTGWGIYTDNGYFSGVIVSSSGKIGGFSIDSNSITNGNIGAANSVWMSTGTGSSANIAGSGSISGWAFTAGSTYGVTKTGALYASSGKIGGWTIDTNKIYSGTHSTWNSTAEDGLYLGNDGIAGGSGGIWYLWKDGSAKIGAMTLSATGELNVPAANIGGKLTANQIQSNSLTLGLMASDVTGAISDAETKATSYISTDIDNTGITVHPAGDNTNKVAINPSGMEIFKDNESVASYGDIARVGKYDGYRTIISPDSFQIGNSDGQILEIESSGRTETRSIIALKLAQNSGIGFYNSGSSSITREYRTSENGIKLKTNTNYTLQLILDGVQKAVDYYAGNASDYITLSYTDSTNGNNNVGLNFTYDSNEVTLNISRVVSTTVPANSQKKVKLAALIISYTETVEIAVMNIEGEFIATGMAGQIVMYAGTTAPNGWLLCDGHYELKADYPELYQVIADIYGTPSDNDYFALPNFKGRTPVGVGTSTATGATAHTLGQMDGEETHKLVISEMPSHNHYSGADVTIRQYGTAEANKGSSNWNWGAYSSLASHFVAQGGNGSHNNMQPYLGINFIIHAGRRTY